MVYHEGDATMKGPTITEILEVINCEIEFHKEHKTPIEVIDYLHKNNMRTPQELVVYELAFLRSYIIGKEDNEMD